MIVYNQTIYGEVNPLYPRPCKVKILIWNYDFSFSSEKQIPFLDSTQIDYQFNLGDRDLFGTNHQWTGYETIIVQVLDGLDAVLYSARIPLTRDCNILHDIVFGAPPSSSNVPNAILKPYYITADMLFIEEEQVDIYSYFHVELAGVVLESGHGSFLRFMPTVDGEYTIAQRGVNILNGLYQERIQTITLYDGLITSDSIDYIFYTKRSVVIQIELPQWVTDTLILEPNWVFQDGLLIGTNNKLNSTTMSWAKGKVIVKTQVGDITDR